MNLWETKTVWGGIALGVAIVAHALGLIGETEYEIAIGLLAAYMSYAVRDAIRKSGPNGNQPERASDPATL